MENPAHFRPRSRHSLLRRSAPLLVSLTFSSLAFFLGGCIFRRKPAIPWATATQVRPTLQAHTASDDVDLQAPQITLDLARLAALLAPVRSAPPRPRTNLSTSPAASTPIADAEKPEASRRNSHSKNPPPRSRKPIRASTSRRKISLPRAASACPLRKPTSSPKSGVS